MSFGLPESGPFTEYGVRYTEYGPNVSVPFITTVTVERWLAERVAHQENQVDGITCELVKREVVRGEWSTA